MRRPLLLFCFAHMAGILLGYYTKIDLGALTAASVIFAAAVLAAYIARRPQADPDPDASYARKQRRRRTLCMIISSALFAFGAFHVRLEESNESALAELEGSAASCSGIVTSCRVKKGYSELTVLVREAGAPGSPPTPFREKVLVRTDEMAPCELFSLAGRRVAFTGKVTRPDGRRNPGLFDYRLYLKGKGIREIVTVGRYRLSTGPVVKVPLNMISAFKGGFLQEASGVLDVRSFGILTGLLFGEKGFMEDDEYELFRHNGIAHVLAVSGLHVGLLYAVVIKLLGGRRDVRSDVTVLAVLTVYAVLSGLSVSVLRASFMIALNIASFRLRRRYDLVSAASLCALVFTAVSPYQIFDSGFQLSFAAAYSLGIVLPWMQARVTRISDERRSDLFYYVGSFAAPCVAVQLGMLPLTLFHFLCFSPVSVIVNPVAIAIAGLLLPAGLSMMAAYGLWASFTALAVGQGTFGAALKLLFAGTCGPAGALADVLSAVATLSEKAGLLLGGFDAPALPFTLTCLYYSLFFWMFSETRHILRRKRRTGALSAVLVLLIASPCVLPKALGITESVIPWDYCRAPFTFLDVGQGDCIHMSSEGFEVLVDGGGRQDQDISERILLPYLLKQGIRKVDLCVVTHLDSDHSLGLAQLSQKITVGCFAFSSVYEGDPRLEDLRSERRIFLSRGDMLSLPGGAVLKVLSPEPGAEKSGEDNDNCLIMAAECRGIRALFTADATEPAELELAASFGPELKAHILKASHHGSAYSNTEALIGCASPSFCVISCGRNNSYGHPAPRVIDLLEKNSIIYGRTDENGAVVIRKDRKGITAENAARDKEWQIPQGSLSPLSTPSRP